MPINSSDVYTMQQVIDKTSQRITEMRARGLITILVTPGDKSDSIQLQCLFSREVYMEDAKEYLEDILKTILYQPVANERKQ